MIRALSTCTLALCLTFLTLGQTSVSAAEVSCFTALSNLVDPGQMSGALEIGDVSRSCYGNIDGGCVTEVCGQLGSSGCRDRFTAIQVAHSCVGVRGGSCVAESCGQLTGARCSDFLTVTGLARACMGQ